jgi:hypothetical protein
MRPLAQSGELQKALANLNSLSYSGKGKTELLERKFAESYIVDYFISGYFDLSHTII